VFEISPVALDESLRLLTYVSCADLYVRVWFLDLSFWYSSYWSSASILTTDNEASLSQKDTDNKWIKQKSLNI